MYYSKLYDLEDLIALLEFCRRSNSDKFIRFEVDDAGRLQFCMCSYSDDKPYIRKITEEDGYNVYIASTKDERDFYPIGEMQKYECSRTKNFMHNFDEIIDNKSGTIKYKCLDRHCENYNCPHFC